MKTKEEMLKKQQEEFNSVRQKLAAMTKKEGGSYLVRDFTDDIYLKDSLDPAVFVEAAGSQVFANLIVVLQPTKLDAFNTDIEGLMKDYYEFIDNTQLKRIPDQAKNLFNEYAEKSNEDLLLLSEKNGGVLKLQKDE